MTKQKKQSGKRVGHSQVREQVSPPFGLTLDSLKHSSNSIVLKRFLHLSKQLASSSDEVESVEYDQQIESVNLQKMLMEQVKHSNEIYTKILKLAKKEHLSQLVQLLVKYPLFCPYQFNYYFNVHPYREISNAKRSMRKLVTIETIQALVRCKYMYVSDDRYGLEYWEKRSRLLRKINEEAVDEDEEEDEQREAEAEAEEEEENPKEENRDEEQLPDNQDTPDIVTVQLNWNRLVANIKSTNMLKDPEEQRVETKRKRSNSPDSALEEGKKLDFKQYPKSEFTVISGDCLDAAVLLKKHKFNPLMLIMASPSHPGGGYRKGSSAQEEQICRRSQLFMCLEDPYGLDTERQWSYPLPEFGGIYLPKVTCIRASEQQGYAFLQRPVDISMIAVAAYNNPPIERVPSNDSDVEEYRLSGKMIPKIKKKVRFIFNTAIEHKHDSLVLSAFGAGAYCNPAKSIAEIFKQVLSEPCYKGAFRYVLFAIIDDINALTNHANSRGNLIPFCEVFHPEMELDQVATLDTFEKELAA